MARVHFVKSAGKDYPEAGIKKGESYYWWRFFHQPKRISKTRPKPSQTTPNEAVSQVLALIERLEEFDEINWSEDDRDELVGQLEEIRDAEQDKFDNLPENFQYGQVGSALEERIGLIDQWIDDLGSIDFECSETEELPIYQAMASIPSF